MPGGPNMHTHTHLSPAAWSWLQWSSVNGKEGAPHIFPSSCLTPHLASMSQSSGFGASADVRNEGFSWGRPGDLHGSFLLHCYETTVWSIPSCAADDSLQEARIGLRFCWVLESEWREGKGWRGISNSCPEYWAGEEKWRRQSDPQ